MRTLLEDEEIVRELRTAAAQKFGPRLVDILRVLNAGRVKFIIVSRLDGPAVDFLYRRDTENIRRLVEALLPFNPKLRTAGVSFSWDEQSVAAGLSFPLASTLGDINLVGELNGARTYEELLPHSATVIVFGQRCQMIAQMQALFGERGNAGLGGRP
jgi:hypothetical protein